MRVLAVLMLALALPVHAEELTAHGRALSVSANPVTIAPGDLAPGVHLVGAWDLDAADPDFGGLSGLLVEAERLIAVTDRGAWLTARLDPGTDPPLSEVRIAPMLAASGRALTGRGADAEGVTRAQGDLYVSFEHDHRIMRHAGRGRLVEAARPSVFARLGPNEGIEGLATLPDGTLMAIAEGVADGGFPLWLLRPRGALTRGALPAVSKHAVTAADIGPDERLYVVQRHFSMLEGVSMRLLRYDLGADRMPDPDRLTPLAAFDSVSGIDNMEGVAVVRAPSGGLHLWLLSDDNFNAPQRTILMLFALPG